MRKVLMDLDKYPILGPVINIKPGDKFRIENVGMEHPEGSDVGSGLFMFTGLFQKYENSTSEYIYCIPLYFYGEKAKELTKLYSGRNVWIELTEILKPNPEYPEHDGYLN